jgi:hypothetical protein
LDDLELARERVEEKATHVYNHLTTWMETFSALEIGISSNVEHIKRLEEGSEWLASHSEGMTVLRGIVGEKSKVH